MAVSIPAAERIGLYRFKFLVEKNNRLRQILKIKGDKFD
jgi:hypothetical protein